LNLPVKILISLLLITFLIVLGKKVLRMERATYPVLVIFYVLVGFAFYPLLEGKTELFSPVLLFSLGVVGFLEGAAIDPVRLKVRIDLKKPVLYFLPSLLLFFALSRAFIGKTLPSLALGLALSLVSLYGVREERRVTVGVWEALAIPLLAVIFSLGRGEFFVSLGYHLVLALIFGTIAYVSLGIKATAGEVNALLLGILLFSSGTSSFLLLSPIFVGFASGVVYANLPKLVGTERMIPKLIPLEKPIFIFLLLYLGFASFPHLSWKALVVSLAFFLVKSLYGLALGEKGFLSLSPLSAAIILSFSTHFPRQLPPHFLSAFALVLLLLEAEEYLLGVREAKRKLYVRR